MSTLELKVYDILKNRFNEKEVFLTKQDKVELVEKIESSKNDIIKWLVAMWIAQMAAIIFTIVKK